jgi:hypothetical protein
MKQRLYICAAILTALALLTWYSDHSMRHFLQGVETQLAQAESALVQQDTTGAMQAVQHCVTLCRSTRSRMTHVLRMEDLTELESSLEATLGYLQAGAPEEARGELRRAVVQVSSLERLSHRLI